MAIFKAPIHCDCKRRYCANNCYSMFVGTLKETRYDCRCDDDCGTRVVADMCNCAK